MVRASTQSIGHSLWDDCVPVLMALEDLGLAGARLRQFDLLLSDAPGPWPRTWTTPSVKSLFSYTSPGGAPVEVASLDEQLGEGRVALLREVPAACGACRRTTCGPT